MLSFTRGRPIALALDKNDNKVFTIHVTPELDEPDINVDNILELIDDADIDHLRNSMKIGNIELKMIKKALLANEKQRGKLNLSEKLKHGLSILEEHARGKLKTEVDFNKSDEVARIIPLIGARDVPYDRSIALVGPSESGKTWLAKEICKFDQRKRPVVVFSKIDDDASLRELKDMRTPVDKKCRIIYIPLHTEDQLLSLPTNEDLKETICLFDDLDSFPSDIAKYMREYRDSILESGRHCNITTMSTSHIMNNHSKTKVILNECELVCLFPAANKRHAFKFLIDRFGMSKIDAQLLIRKAMLSGRMLCLKLSCPNMVIHNKGVILI